MTSKFDQAFMKTMYHEGGHSKHSADAGGETYRGIARNRHPTWAGWLWIDQAKALGKPVDEEALSTSVKAFYWKGFWNPIRGDELPQPVAEELFDTGVNMGVVIAVKFLQESLNTLNRNGTLLLAVDGGFGPATLAAVEALQNKDIAALVKVLNILQGNRYIEIIRNKPSQAVFARGWLSRVTL